MRGSGLHSNILRVCCAETTNDQVMCLRSFSEEEIAVAMGEMMTAAANPLTICQTQQAPRFFCKLIRQLHSKGSQIQAVGQNNFPSM